MYQKQQSQGRSQGSSAMGYQMNGSSFNDMYKVSLTSGWKGCGDYSGNMFGNKLTKMTDAGCK
jgi:hypothetical protein